MRTITHSPVRKYSAWESAFYRGEAIDHAPAPMPGTGPHPHDTAEFLDAALAKSDCLSPINPKDYALLAPMEGRAGYDPKDCAQPADWGAVSLLLANVIAWAGVVIVVARVWR
jgi:hypothetical protein